MATREEQAAFVERCVPKFAEAEKKGGEYYNAILDLVPLMKEGQALGLAGFLQASRMKNDLRAAAGGAANTLATIFAIHGEGTQLAQDLGVDVPHTEDGSPR